MNFLNQRTNPQMQQFLDDYCRLFPNIDRSKSVTMINNAMKYYKGNSKYRDQIQHLINLENRWYDNDYDFSIYDDDYYFTDIFSCWIVYSKQYLKSILRDNSLTTQSIYSVIKSSKSVLDMGCGIGYTTVALKELFPNARVTGTNLENTKQFKFCKLHQTKYDVDFYGKDIKALDQKYDLIFASEYFEHLRNPIEQLHQLINNQQPKYLLIANAFNTRSMGHFKEYIHRNELICQSKMNRIFNDALKHYGYKKIKTKLWNQRPAFWVKS